MADSASATDEVAIPHWLRAGLADIESLDFEQPIAGSTTADCHELGDLFRLASQSSKSGADEIRDCARVRVYDLLSGISGMLFRPADTNEPFGPMVVFFDGRRSAAPADFRDHLPLLCALATATKNLVLRARLSDLVWLLERKQAVFGLEALKAYVEIVRGLGTGDLKSRDEADNCPFPQESRDYLHRALHLARMLGWSKFEAEAARIELIALRKRAVRAHDPGPVRWYCELDLKMRVSDPVEIAREIEELLAHLHEHDDHHTIAHFWQLAAGAYRAGKKNEDKERCQVAAAEVMAAEAKNIVSPMLASNLLAGAISALHGVSSARQRRLELRHRLVEIQANVSEEMKTFSQEMDLSDLAEEIQGEFKSLSVYDSLFTLAAIHESPDPKDTRADAIEILRKSPLSSLFRAVHLDNEGKVIHRTASGGFGEIDEPSIVAEIAKAEKLRRHIYVSGAIDPARRAIIQGYYLSDDILYNITNHSPFVPPDLAHTFARGLSRFFQGDFISALYILTPMLEDALRHVLKSHGHDVSTFDNANQTQEDRTITSLYDGMRAELNSILTCAITDDIERVFLIRPGPAIRHGVAHGLLSDGSPYGADAVYGCWLIFRLCILPLFQYRKQLSLS